MFSGIVEAVSPILKRQTAEGLLRLQIARPVEFSDLKIGESISVNGICLTIEAFDNQQMSFALAAETLQVLGMHGSDTSAPPELMALGQLVNLERSLRYGDRVHGHFVTGHVQGLGKVVKLDFIGESLICDIQLSEKLLPFIWPKCSLAVNGTSLTVNAVSKNLISLCLIPETQKRTNLASLKIGDHVTIEPDVMTFKMMRSAKDQFNTIAELVEAIRQGEMVILVDDENRENEGDLVLAADHVSADKINFMSKEARGLICLSLLPEQVARLQLPKMVPDQLNRAPNKTAFMVSIEAAEGVTTGISAADRARTIRVASSPSAHATDIHMPGHIFPIQAQEGGVLARPGHTEGSVDLARLAGLTPAGVICEVMNDDGSMARVPDLFIFARKHGLKIGTIFDLIQYRQEGIKNEDRNRDLAF